MLITLIDFLDLLTDAVADSLGLSGIDNDAYIASNLPLIWNAIQFEQEIRKREGVNPILQLVSAVRKCRWHSIGHGSSQAELRHRLCLRSRPSIISRIDALNWRQFEALGCAVAQMCGANQLHLTPPGNECGVDFFATIMVNGNNHIFFVDGTPLRIVGQCKKYESRVDVENIRAFNEALTDVQKKERKITALVPPWCQAARGPIIGWMVAHKGFKSGAKLALITMDSLSRHDRPRRDRRIIKRTD